MTARDVLKNINLFVDGRGYAGQVQQYTPPSLAISTEEFRAGGMDAPIDIEMGQEKMSTSFVLIGYNSEVLTQWGIGAGAAVQFTARGVLESWNGQTKAVVHKMRGKMISLDKGEWTPGQPAPLTCNLTLSYFQETHDEIVTHEVDVENMIRIVNGVDRLAAQRAALGIGG